jgi:uncharacterized membrane protein
MRRLRMIRKLKDAWTSPEWLGLVALALFTLMAILGYGVFGRNPNLIPDSDSARQFYGLSFQLFARAHILLAGLVLAIPLIRRIGVSWVPAFFAVFLVSFLSEFVGTGYGVPFGGYSYTSLLGLKLGGRVPAVIPLSWFLMALPSWAMANAVFPGESQRLGRALMGGYLLTAWDLALDPAMSHLTPYWIWEHSGPFYGMPWVNLAGWMGTGVVLMILLEVFGSRRWGGHLPVGWLSAYYGLVLLMPLGMVVAAGLWWAVLATVAALSLAVGLHLALRARASARFEPALAHGSAGS